jgi:membrane protease YdiL (CAAX protease family)
VKLFKGELQNVTQNKPTIFVVGVTFELGLAVLAIGLGALFGMAPLAAIWIDSVGSALTGVLSGIVLAWPPFAVLVGFDRYPPRHFARIKQILNDEIMPLFAGCGPGQMIILALAAGIGEEMLFRGFLQDLLARTFHGTVGLIGAVVVTNIAFGLVHRLTWMYAIWAFGMGLYLSLVYLWSGNLLEAIIAHACYDALALLYLAGQKQTRRSEAG